MPTFPMTLPSGVTGVALIAQRSVTISENPLSLQTFKQDWGGDRWTANVSVQTRNVDTVREWRGFLMALANNSGNFLLGDPYYNGAGGDCGGTVQVDGAGQVGTVVNLKGFTASRLVLKKGDMFEIASRLYVVLEDCNSDGTGDAAVSIFPGLRDAPANNTSVVFANPRGLFRISDSPSIESRLEGFYSVSFTAVEDI